MDEIFVLLDDCNAQPGNPSSRLYTEFSHQRICHDPHALDAFWTEVEAEMASGLHAAVFADYEWGARLLRAGDQALHAQSGALRVLLFRAMQTIDAGQVDAWLAARDASDVPTVAGVMALKPSVSRSGFEQGIQNILELIRAGETYQVNYTYRLHSRMFGSPLALYRRLRAVQPVSFGCLAAMPSVDNSTIEPQDQDWVLSCSPELFVRNTAGHLTTRPMKGTAPRMLDAKADDGRGLWLSQDPKNLAENVMIVDLLRNDLGRISEIGSVKVPKLFAVETYSTVHQMTSTVESRILPGIGFADVLRALFPCGSITGTPKVHTMDLIAQLESTPRGLYCGAIGWVEAPNKASRASSSVGDFCLSVAIRTLQVGPRHDGMRPVTLGVGGGVVIDSTQSSEFDETLVKARFLTQVDPGFTLFETLLVRNGRALRIPLHMARLQSSAEALGFAFDAAKAQMQLAQHTQTLNTALAYRVRLDLHRNGTLTLASNVLEPIAQKPVSLVWATAPVSEQERALAAHKTSLRGTYDAAIQYALQQGAFDAIFVNAQGDVTEGARSSVFVKLDGRWCTPSLQSGALPGVMRSRVLSIAPAIVQRPIHRSELAEVQEIAVCNALRGVLRAKLLTA